MDAIAYAFTQWPAYAITCATILGLIVGSFLNVVIYRMPVMLWREWEAECHAFMALKTATEKEAGTKNETDTLPPALNLITPSSHCPHCQRHIKPLENIPVLSFLFLRGRCAGCNAKIAWRYPLVELLSGLLSAAVVWRFGFTAQAGFALLLTWALIALSFIDIDEQLLPDNIVLPLLWLGLLINAFNVYVTLEAALFGAIIGYLSLWAVFHTFKWLTSKEGMGYGDFKLFALFGAWLGWQMLLPIILIASLTGSIAGLIALIVRKRSLPIPFGPYLAAGGWFCLMWGSDVIRAYLRFAVA